MKEKPKNEVPAIRDLFPLLNGEELNRAEEDFRAYVEIAVEIYEAICQDPERYERFMASLTARARASTMKRKTPAKIPTQTISHP